MLFSLYVSRVQNAWGYNQRKLGSTITLNPVPASAHCSSRTTLFTHVEIRKKVIIDELAVRRLLPQPGYNGPRPIFRSFIFCKSHPSHPFPLGTRVQQPCQHLRPNHRPRVYHVACRFRFVTQSSSLNVDVYKARVTPPEGCLGSGELSFPLRFEN